MTTATPTLEDVIAEMRNKASGIQNFVAAYQLPTPYAEYLHVSATQILAGADHLTRIAAEHKAELRALEHELEGENARLLAEVEALKAERDALKA